MDMLAGGDRRKRHLRWMTFGVVIETMATLGSLASAFQSAVSARNAIGREGALGRLDIVVGNHFKNRRELTGKIPATAR